MIEPDHDKITPIAKTVPGIEYGKIDNISSKLFPRGFMRFITYAIITPKNIQTSPAVTDKNKEFLIESRVAGEAKTFS